MSASAGLSRDSGTLHRPLPPPTPQATSQVSVLSDTSLTDLRIHLHRLQSLFAICPGQVQIPSFRLTIADVRLALQGREGVVEPLFASWGCSMHEIHETLAWVSDHFSDEQLLDLDVIQLLLVPLLEAQFEARRAAKRGRYEHQ